MVISMTNCGVYVHPRLRWIVVFLLLQVYSLISTQDVNVEFLTAVPRLESTTIDYYFCCNVIGRFLHWQYDNQSLSGFLIEDIGRVFVDERLDYNYTATLLSSQPIGNNQAEMDSVLVLSFHNGTNPSQFIVTCSSNLNINSTTAGHILEVKSSNRSKEVQLDYVVSGNIVSNRNRTYLFMCGVRNTPLFIVLNGRSLGFSLFDMVGLDRTIFLKDRNTADVQGILITQESNQVVTLVLVATSSDVINVSCFDSFNHVTLSLQSCGEEELSENIPKDTTNAMLVTTESLTGSVAENVTALIDPANDLFGIFWVISMNFLVLVAVVMIIIFIMLIRLKKLKRSINPVVSLSKVERKRLVR